MEQGTTVEFNESEVNQKKLLCGIFGIVLGAFGIHKFLLGYNKAGIIMLAISIVVIFLGPVVMAVIGIIEGITYLTKSNREFYDTYMANTKDWF